MKSYHLQVRTHTHTHTHYKQTGKTHITHKKSKTSPDFSLLSLVGFFFFFNTAFKNTSVSISASSSAPENTHCQQFSSLPGQRGELQLSWHRVGEFRQTNVAGLAAQARGFQWQSQCWQWGQVTLQGMHIFLLISRGKCLHESDICCLFFLPLSRENSSRSRVHCFIHTHTHHTGHTRMYTIKKITKLTPGENKANPCEQWGL